MICPSSEDDTRINKKKIYKIWSHGGEAKVLPRVEQIRGLLKRNLFIHFFFYELLFTVVLNLSLEFVTVYVTMFPVTDCQIHMDKLFMYVCYICYICFM